MKCILFFYIRYTYHLYEGDILHMVEYIQTCLYDRCLTFKVVGKVTYFAWKINLRGERHVQPIQDSPTPRRRSLRGGCGWEEVSMEMEVAIVTWDLLSSLLSFWWGTLCPCPPGPPLRSSRLCCLVRLPDRSVRQIQSLFC